MSGLEAWLDVLPGETRGVIARGDRFEQLIIQRESDRPQDRLGARLVGRVSAVAPGLAGAFVDLGAGEPFGFLPLRRGAGPDVGQKLELEVTAEPRAGKGPTLRRLGPAEGEPRLLAPGPDAAELLARLAPGVTPATGAAALRAGQDAEAEALPARHLFPEAGLDLELERTRALVAVDIDFAGAPGRDPRRARARANAAGLAEAARLLRLKAWGGLVCVDLAGEGGDGPGVAAAARAAFGPEAALGPVSRFGLMQLALPWGRRPLEERLLDAAGRPTPETRAIALVRQARLAELTDPATPRWACVCRPDEARAAEPLLARLGPRFVLRPDPAVPPGAARVEEI